MSQADILIVDDDPDMRQGLQICLRANGYDVHCAEDGVGAISEARKHTPDLIVLDLIEDAPEGLTDKLYWRKARGEWHSFKKLAQVRGYVSLCQRREIASVYGRQIARPEAHFRCGLCDGLEMERRRGRAGPVSPRRAGSFSR